MKHFWAEVIKPFGSWALCNLDHSHLYRDVMHLNQGAKSLDYGVWEHIAFICSPFFQGIESCLQYEWWRKRWEDHCQIELAGGYNHAHSCGPGGREWEPDDQGSERSEHEDRSQSKSTTWQDRRGQQSRSWNRGSSQPPDTESPHNSYCLHGWRLPTPLPWSQWEDTP